MSFIYVGRGSTVGVTSGSLTLNEPAGVQSGDLLVATIAFRDTTGFTSPTGWTRIQQRTAGNSLSGTSAASSLDFEYLVRGSSAPDLTFTRTGGAAALGFISVYRNVHATTPYVAQKSKNSTTHETILTLSGPDTTADGQLAIFMHSVAGYDANGPGVTITGMDTTAGIQEVDYAKATTSPMDGWNFLENISSPSSNGIGLVVAHSLITDKSTSHGNISSTVTVDAIHSAAAATFASALPDDSDVVDTSKIYAVSGFVKTGPSVRTSKVYVPSGFVDDGPSVRTSKVYAVIDTSKPDVARQVIRRVISNRIILSGDVYNKDLNLTNMQVQDGNFLLMQDGTNFLAQRP